MFKGDELRPDVLCSLLVDAGNQVVIRECNYDAPQQWIFTDDAQLTLANNTSAFPAAPLFLLTVAEICYIYIRPMP